MQVFHATTIMTMQSDSRAKNETPEPKLGHTTQIVWPFLIQVSAA